MYRFLFTISLLPLFGCSDRLTPSGDVLRLATTTSTRDSGLLEVLLPPFERAHQVRVDVVAVGTGRALKLAEAGDADLVLVHAREAEDAFMAAGFGTRREDVMHNYFEILGPADDPARIQKSEPATALQKIATARAHFVSRSDDSGTHHRERALWQAGGGRPEWSDYVETGQGMGPSLVVADQLQAYILCDRGTYLNFEAKLDLVPLVTGSPELRNPYGAIVVSPAVHPAVREQLAHRLADYFIAADTRQRIDNYRLEGEQLFYAAPE